MNDPERLDLPSASSAYRRRRCTGSENLIKALRKAGKLPAALPDQFAASGERVHQAWCGEAVTLTPSESDTLKGLQRMEQMVVVDWAARDEYTLLGREQRMWLHDGLEPIHSGQYDVLYGTFGREPRLLILDGKTLYREVLPAESNDQLRELVALARHNFANAESFTVAILQPNVAERISVAVYDRQEAELALRLLRFSLADAADPHAPRNAGQWCKYCPAVTACPEARAHAERTVELAKAITTGQVLLPEGEMGAKLLGAIGEAQGVLEALKQRYREILAANPQAIPGWYLREGKRVRLISEVYRAFDALGTQLTLEEFLACTKLNVMALERHLGREGFNAALSHLISYKEVAPYLAREPKHKPQELS